MLLYDPKTARYEAAWLSLLINHSYLPALFTFYHHESRNAYRREFSSDQVNNIMGKDTFDECYTGWHSGAQDIRLHVDWWYASQSARLDLANIFFLQGPMSPLRNSHLEHFHSTRISNTVVGYLKVSGAPAG